ncbi:MULTISPECIES: peptide-methionine (S)-S-oxide reductase MsrA [unclassified Pseudomonas]|uniref:peptide-methionine (S)-S-oxide reductase MsrA n=1 Tax=unclassified Pseudomonas TaxID=196821 RepID=UPI000D399E97|nr:MULTISPECIES: peptide-methionine (S)-S-oxide reductase MsrA [unclassified Pseudomonas]RAU44675.1 peptide-methionine (S)-S-oxide reductase [Pseudomonas sp. RIT 409]RAU54889.1 peptide-methionine (S)-S-oxide reductase [Pseudomonas sp. RIT 412]
MKTFSLALSGLRRNSLRLALGVVVLQTAACSFAGEDAVSIAPPQKDERVSTAGTEKAVLAGGCFWGVQGVFQHVQGVRQVVSGYAGGSADTAHYERVSEGDTGHAESVEITYDPSQVSYGTLLQIFFSVAHNPTELNRQGPDHGTQYRSAIFPENAEQQAVAQAYIAQLDAAKAFGAPIVTQIERYNGFYPAEDYHQNFLTTHPTYPYIVVNDLPKVSQLKQLFATRYSEQPVLLQTAK